MLEPATALTNINDTLTAIRVSRCAAAVAAHGQRRGGALDCSGRGPAGLGSCRTAFRSRRSCPASCLQIAHCRGVLGPQEILGSNPWDVIQTSILRDTLGTLNIPNWIRLLTKASLPGADIYPGKYSK